MRKITKHIPFLYNNEGYFRLLHPVGILLFILSTMLLFLICNMIAFKEAWKVFGQEFKENVKHYFSFKVKLW